MPRRRKKAQSRRRVSLAHGETAPNPATKGDRRREAAEPADAPALNARTRIFEWHKDLGPRPDPKEPLAGSQAGLCILALGKGGDGLKDVWGAISASRRAYLTRYVGATGEPQCATAPVLSESMQTDQSLRIDLRTPEERDRAASQGWKHWQALLASLPAPQMKWAIDAALGDSINPEAGRLWGRNGLPTANGKTFVAALRVLAGQKVGIRVRESVE